MSIVAMAWSTACRGTCNKVPERLIGVLTLLLLLDAALTYPHAALANGTIAGHVKTSSGAAVPYTRVTWGAVTTGGCINNPGHAYTNSAGNWQSPVLINGSYSVGSGSSPCVDKVYLCTAGNAPAINNNNVTGINFIKPLYSITAPVGPGGLMTVTYGDDADSPTIAATGSVPAVCNALMHFNITPDGCHTIANVVVDGSSIGAVSSYTFSGVQANHSISVSFAANVIYTITSSVGPSGAISPLGSITVGCGGSQTFTITPNGCYQVDDVLVDGASVGARASYTFTNVQANHTISASFSTAPGYSITASAGSNGSISPSGSVFVSCGGGQTFTMAPSTCYHVQSVVVDGSSVGTPSSYTFSNVQGSHTISVSFSTDTYVIASSAGTGGSITPSGSVAVNCGTNRAFTITASTCYVISNVLVDGASVGALTSYSFNNVQVGHTIAASFAPNTGSLPGAPTGITVTNLGSGSSLQLSWNSVSGATSYTVHRTGGGPSADIPTSTDGLVDDGLSPGTTYTYSVAALNGCGTGPYAAPRSRLCDYFPILLVHGLCGSHHDFTDCSGVFPCQISQATRIGDALYQLGFSRIYYVDYDVYASLTTASQAVAAAMTGILAAQGDPKLNIVAHSQGGLIARYLAQRGYGSQIQNIVMVGTPNHGSDWARLAGLAPSQQPKLARNALARYMPCLLTSLARYDLQPGSAFLNQLNYGSSTNRYDSQAFRFCSQRGAENLQTGVNYWLFHGGVSPFLGPAPMTGSRS